MPKKIKIVSTATIVFLLPLIVSAQAALDKLQSVGGAGGFNNSDASDGGTALATTVGKLIQAFLGILGIIFIILILLAGFNWMTAAGEEEKVTRAKDTLRRAIIGLIIIVSAWGIWAFISTYVINGGNPSS
jgi:cytochrome bd-type quinol oxidase subunit 2